MKGASATVDGLRLDVPAGGARDTILDIAALELSPGALVVVTGPSGSGKSTLLHLLSGLLVPSAGRIAWNGEDIAALGEAARDRWRRRNAGFVFQNFHLIDELSPLDNALAPSWFSGQSRASLRQRAERLLTDLGVPARRSTALLSRGEQQRVAIARSLLMDPPVIFADEPTASLDAASGARVIAILGQLAAEGRTVVATGHDPALVSAAGRVIAIERGRIAPQRKTEAAA